MEKRNIIFIALLVVTVIGVYWRTLDYPLIWDDEIYFKHNLLFNENYPLKSALKFSYFSEQLGVQSQDHYYRPLLTASFLLENKLWGIKNVTLRLTNLMIYILALVFLFFFLKAQSDKNYFAEMGTLLFALYPLNLDNIVWVVGRGDLFLLLWGALTFLFLDFSIRKRRALFLVGSSLFYALGLFSKETCLLLLPLLVLYEVLKRKKVSVFYHSANLLIALSYFFLKNSVLGIKNIRFIFNQNIMEDIRAALGTLGFYARTLLFPISYDMFMPLKKAESLFYVLIGAGALFLILFLIIRTKRDQAIAWPLAALILFLGGHVALIFTNVFPFQIYSRYMMLPALGAFWILAEYLTRIKEKTRLSIVFILLVFFIPSIVINASAYRSKAAFWQRASRSFPDDEHVLLQRAKFLCENNDYLSAEVALNRILTLKVNPLTAVLTSLLYADIDMLRAKYENVLRWMKSIEEFEQDRDLAIAPQIRYFENSKTAKVQVSEGNFESAEKLLTDNIQRYGRFTEAYKELYNLYIGFQMWDRASRLETAMKKVFPRHFASLNTRLTQEQFENLPPDKKISFYVLGRDFDRAVQEVQKMPAPDLDHRIFLAKLSYFQGKEDQGRTAVTAILAPDPNNVEVLNKIGNFYLNELFRVREAMDYFDRSLSLNPAQPALLYLTTRLKKDYLSQLIEVWK
jgi:tetratricopeptide (TPR) repeat protein